MYSGVATSTHGHYSTGLKANDRDQRRFEAGIQTKSTSTAVDTQANDIRMDYLLPSQSSQRGGNYVFRKRKHAEIDNSDDDDEFLGYSQA